jgi:hypothetical protein
VGQVWVWWVYSGSKIPKIIAVKKEGNLKNHPVVAKEAKGRVVEENNGNSIL